MDEKMIDRAKGCLVGMIAGDSLGSLVEFRSPEEIAAEYLDGVRELKDGGVWNTLAGQPTDDGEMALALARTLVRLGTFEVGELFHSYEGWLDSDPFDCGHTTRSGLSGVPNKESQANGALMQIAPLGVFGTRNTEDEVAMWADLDAGMTHPHRVCREINVLYTLAIREAVLNGTEPEELYRFIKREMIKRDMGLMIRDAVREAADGVSSDYMTLMGWVIIAFQNALYQLLHAASPEEGIADTISRGGDTDTNGCIAGALLGAVWGVSAFPGRWREIIAGCRPKATRRDVRRPRPEIYWPCDVEELAVELITA